MPALAQLRRHPLLADFTPNALALLADQAVLRTWRSRQTLFRRGDPAVGLILLLEGRVRVFCDAGGRRRMLHIEEAGGTLGEVPLFDGSGMPATAVAAEAAEGVLIVPRLLQKAMVLDPGLAERLLHRLARRVRVLADRLEHLTEHSVANRLAAALLARMTSDTTHRTTDITTNTSSNTVDLGMSQEEFAEEIGTVREVLVRELGVLVRAGILRPLGRRRLEVLDPAGLRAAIDG
ncbi:MAG: Crp/Fnr family transcriptional regulator [Gemmatimonadota bacterium]